MVDINLTEIVAITPEEERPGQVIFLVITDGAENSSKEFKNAKKVAEMVRHQTEKYNWTFTFLGGGDAEFQKAQAANLGFMGNNIYNYSATSGGTEKLYGAISRGVSVRRDKAVLYCAKMDANSSLLSEEDKEDIKTP